MPQPRRSRYIPPGFPAPPSLLVRPVEFLDDGFFFEFFAAERNLTLQGCATVRQVKSLRQFHAILVERLDNELCALPAGNTLSFDLPYTHQTAFPEAKFLDDRSIKTDEQCVRRLCDLERCSGLEKHIDQTAFH